MSGQRSENCTYTSCEIALQTHPCHGLLTTVKHVYSDNAYNEMTLITKHLGIPGKHSIYFFIHFMLTAKSHITKSSLYNEVILKPLHIKDHSI